MMPPTSKRLRELDLLRAIAILLMVLFHLVVDLTDFYHAGIPYRSGFWCYEGRLSAILFIFVSGICATLGRHPVKRGLQVLSAGFLIIAATYLFSPHTYVRFGILQLLGCSMLLYEPLKRLATGWLLLVSLLILFLGNKAAAISVPFDWLLPLGLTSTSFVSMDYYPLLPWFGLFLAGTIAGRLLYRQRQPLCRTLPQWKFLSWAEWLGKHSLLIYLLHQPVLLLFLYLLYGYN